MLDLLHIPSSSNFLQIFHTLSALQLDKLRGPMSHLPVEFYEVEFGFRK
jgi:hypothetical protein